MKKADISGCPNDDTDESARARARQITVGRRDHPRHRRHERISRFALADSDYPHKQFAPKFAMND